MSPKSEHPVPGMTIDAAISYADKLYRHVEERAEGGGPEAIDVAFDQFERRFGVGRWTRRPRQFRLLLTRSQCSPPPDPTHTGDRT